MSDLCSSCGASIVWAHTPAGNIMPVNAAAADDGTVMLVERPKLPLQAIVLGATRAAGARAAGKQLHRSHFVDCPQADRWRRKR